MKFHVLLTLGWVVYANILYAQTWKELNPPPNIFNDNIFSVAADTKGNIYAAGEFKNSENENIVAKWDGQQWAELGTGNKSLEANNIIYCIVTDKSGNVYAAGGFANSTGNISIAKWNGSTWSEVGGVAKALNPNGSVLTMAIDEKNNLFVAGSFTDTSGYGYVAEWNGSKWLQLGTEANALHANGFIYSLTTDAKGNVYAAGNFTNKDGKYYVAKWDGTKWIELGENTPLNANDYINCIEIDAEGNVYAAGGFKDSAGEYYVAKWNGANWSEVGNDTNNLTANGPFNAIAVNTNGTIYAGGFGTDLNGATNVIIWDGNTHSEIFNVGYSTNDAIRTLCLDKAGNLYAAGDFKNGGGHSYVAEWNGASMKEVGFQGDNLRVINGIHNIAVDSRGEIYASGDFFSPALGNYYLARWNGKTWSRLEGGPAGSIDQYYPPVMTTDLSGNLYVTGHFTNSKGKYYIAKWDGHSWSQLGGTRHPIKIYEPLGLLTCDKKGNIYAVGAFGDSSGYTYDIMKWDGAKKSFYALNGGICSLVVDSAGNIYAGSTVEDQYGKYYVEEINENGISQLGSGANALNSGSKITALAIDRNGNLLASGSNNEGYSEYNKFVAKWNGTSWSSAGSEEGSYAEGDVSSMVSDDSGNVYAAGATNSNSYFSVAKWDGTRWSELGSHNYFNGVIGTLVIDAKGDIYAAGLFSNGRFQFVAEYQQGRNNGPSESPMVSEIAEQYCHTAKLQSATITNLPDTSVISVSIKLDRDYLTLQPGNRFTFDPSTLSPGQHVIKILYSTHTDTTSLIKYFDIIAPATPLVKIIPGTLVSTDNDPIVITAKNVTGGGINPTFIFSKDKENHTVLQPESSDNTLILNPDELDAGDNMIYVTMLTSNDCYIDQTSIDSIDIRQSMTTAGITDPDYPGQKILPYPNPFNGTLRIKGFQASKAYIVSMINSMGKTIFQKSFSNRIEVNIKEITQQGIYWITVYDKTKNRTLGSVSVIKN